MFQQFLRIQALLLSEDHVFNDDNNWKQVTNLKAPDQERAGEMKPGFDKVNTSCSSYPYG